MWRWGAVRYWGVRLAVVTQDCGGRRAGGSTDAVKVTGRSCRFVSNWSKELGFFTPVFGCGLPQWYDS
jgi:hypothetical protein